MKSELNWWKFPIDDEFVCFDPFFLDYSQRNIDFCSIFIYQMDKDQKDEEIKLPLINITFSWSKNLPFYLSHTITTKISRVYILSGFYAENAHVLNNHVKSPRKVTQFRNFCCCHRVVLKMNPFQFIRHIKAYTGWKWHHIKHLPYSDRTFIVFKEHLWGFNKRTNNLMSN